MGLIMSVVELLKLPASGPHRVHPHWKVSQLGNAIPLAGWATAGFSAGETGMGIST